MKRRLLALTMALLMLVSLVPMQAMADDTLLTEGTVTVDGITYTLENGTLTVSGEGVCSNVWTKTFDKDSVTKVVIQDGITKIDGQTFHSCTSLQSITLPDSLTELGLQAFCGCTSLKSIDVPESVTYIDISAFRDCAVLESITLPDGLTKIGYSAFYNTAYYNSEANWENGVLYIGKYLIEAKEDIAGDYTVKDGTLLLADSAFAYCTELESVTLSDGLTYVAQSAFEGCEALESIAIPDGVIMICNSAFSNCAALKTVTIPASVTKIDVLAFWGCTALTDVYYGGTRAQWAQIDMNMGNDALLNATVHFADDYPFTDIENSGHHDNIVRAYGLKLIYGYNETTFAPDDNLNRGQFITMLWRMAGEPKATAELSFTDAALIPDAFKTAVAWGVENKIIFGYSDGSFSYSAQITRGAMAAMMHRYIVNVVKMEITDEMKAAAGFKDAAYISNGFVEAVNVMTNLGIISGYADNTFRANENATRGQTATLLVRLYDLLNAK